MTSSQGKGTPNVCKVFPEVHRFCPVLQAVHPTPGRQNYVIVQVPSKRRQTSNDPTTPGHNL